jgi:hypothetical protein
VEGSGHGTITAFVWKYQIKPRKSAVGIVGVPAEIRTGLFPNKNQKRYISQFARLGEHVTCFGKREMHTKL